MDGPVPSLSAGPKGDSPEELMQFLDAIIHKSLNGVDHISIKEKKAWVTLVMELSEHFLASFPTSGTGLWNAYSEKTKLSLASLEVIQRSARLVEDFLLIHEEHTHAIIMRILMFSLAIASWGHSHPEPCGPPDLCPRSVHRKAIESLEIVVRALKLKQSSDCSPSLFVEECVDSVVSLLRDSVGDPESLSVLSKFEPLVLNESKNLIEIRIDIESIHQFAQSMADLVLFASYLYSSGFISSCAKLKLYRELCTLTRRLVEALLSQSLTLPSRLRSEALSMVLRASGVLYSLQGYASDMVGLIPATVLLLRLREGPNADWDATDRELLLIFESGHAVLPLFNHTMLLQGLNQEQWGDDGELLREISYTALNALVPLLDGNALLLLAQSLAKRPQTDKLKDINDRVRERLDESDPVLGKRKRNDDSWKSAVVTLLETEIYNGSCGSQSSDQMLDSGWKSRVLDNLKRTFSQSLRDSSRVYRIQALKALQKLPCLLSHPDENNCLQASAKPAISIIPCYLICVSKLLNGPEAEVDAVVRKAGHDAITSCLRHHSKGYGDDHLDAVVEFIKGGMEIEERFIRIAAGRALVELVRLYCGIGRGASKRVDSAFDYIGLLLNERKDTIRETTLVSLGLIGRLTDADILGRVLSRLVLQLGGSNILLRGAAYCQILSLAKFHNKTPYLLLSPYLPSLAPLIASSLVVQPNLLIETCRFLSLSPGDFLSVTLPHTLPHLFATCNADALRKLSIEVRQNISTLFLNSSSHILAHVFSLPGSAECERSINFITRTLSEATNGDSKIGIQSVVRSCLIPLLGLLVISMGDESRIAAENAAVAITRVERSMNTLSGVPKKKTAHQLGNFLKEYTLGIIANLSDVLQDVQGRKSEATKRSVLRGLASLIREVGSAVNTVAPQIMATLQTTVNILPLSEVSLRTWYDFLVTLDVQDLGPHVGPTTATLVNVWPQLSAQSREIAKKCTSYIASDVVKSLGEYVNEIADFSAIPELTDCANKVLTFRSRRSVRERLTRILDRCSSDNVTVAYQALEELRAFMTVQHEGFVRDLASGDVFDPLVGDVIRSLLCIACRDGEGANMIRLLALDCIGIIGAVDPDRFDLPGDDPHMVVLNNFTDENEAIQFALHLIENALVGAFRSTSDIKYQSHLAYAIQELLKFCKFTSALITPGNSVPNKIRNRWNDLPKHVLETITPLLEGKFAVHNPSDNVTAVHPIYHGQGTYREWIQQWCTYLISKVNGQMAKDIFKVFCAVLRNRDVGIAHQLLPHLVLNILISGGDEDTTNIQVEITTVLEDQLNPNTNSSSDKKLLSSQVIFMLMDHLNKWIRRVRQEISARRNETKRSRQSLSMDDMDIQLSRVDSILANIDPDLMARAAFECKSYARALMNFEKQIVALRERDASQECLEAYYEKLHEIYAHLDEPDGMEGISTFITFPSIEHQIRQHENTGKWTSAQSCWEVRVQQSPDLLDNHVGLLRCLRNLGHYDSLRTHIQGVVVRYPHLESALTGFKIEGLLMNNDWDDVESAMASMPVDTWETAMAGLLLAMRSKDGSSFSNALSSARMQFGSDISAAGQRGYRRAYDSVLKLHLVHDIKMIHDLLAGSNGLPVDEVKLTSLFQKLASRLESTLPTFRTREPILSMHRTTFSLNQLSSSLFRKAIGHAWLESSKIARKAGHWQTAYSAVLQAQENKAPFSFVQLAKLSKASGDPLRALYDLEHALRGSAGRHTSGVGTTIDEDSEAKRLQAKAKLLRVRWMRESDRYDTNVVANELSSLAKSLRGMENAHFHSGNFQDDCYKALGPVDKRNRGLKMALFIIRAYANAIRAGNKYIFQTIPRLITLWLDVGEDDQTSESDQFITINNEVLAAVQQTPVYKWLNAFPQITSRVDHKNKTAYDTLAILISSVLQEYPKQALWQFVSVVKSTKSKRERRGREILDQLKNNPRNAGTRVPILVDQAKQLATELLNLCDLPIKDNRTKVLSLSRHCPALERLMPSDMIIPLQESMTASLPPTSSAGITHQPFPSDAPTISKIFEDIEVMSSLAKPRKITIEGSDGQIYMFLGKPKDDLRKDARLMDFNSMINKLLRSNSDSRRRRLHIRTYSVVTLNEECGFIQWVPNTMPIRPILVKYYSARGVEPYSREMGNVFDEIKKASDKEASKMFQEKILSLFPPLFHEWFLDTFPEPTAWLSSRLSYGRTAAVMSMVGFILGLGDRHLENILLDVVSGDVVHVDFNCLFEKGKTLETPERVPFRLTNNIVDGLGVTGVEGTFRKSCEITMQLLRDNKDSLMSVLDAFIHDPLVEWEDEKRKIEKAAKGDRNTVKESMDLRKLAQNALQAIEKKLKGVYTKEANRNDRRHKEISTSNLVQMLIEEATDKRNLAKMYPGWAPWH